MAGEPGATAPAQVDAVLTRAVADHEILDFSLPLAPDAPARLRLPGTGLLSVRLSLLNTEALPARPDSEPSRPRGWVVHDVFSNGRLDGSALAGLGYRSTLLAPPTGIRDLRATFEPVLALGYLTEHRDRTLAQAALRFCLAWPWVVTAVVPLPDPPRFDEILGYAQSPPLTAAELARAVSSGVSDLSRPTSLGTEGPQGSRRASE